MSRLNGSPEALDDLARADHRLRRLLDHLLTDFELTVGLVRTGHPVGPITPSGRPNDHWFYRAVDIEQVNGTEVRVRPNGTESSAVGA